MSDQLLPANATDLERAIAATFARILDIPVPIRETRRADVCPEAFLPWLAWERRVAEWDDAWPLEARRDVVASRYAIISRNATRWAVIQAIAKAQVPGVVTYQSWFEYGGAPYHFRLRVDLPEGVAWSAADTARLRRAAIGAKSVRSYPADIAVRLPSPSAPVYVGVAPISEFRTRPLAEPPRMQRVPATVFVGVAAFTAIRTRVQ